MKSLNKETGVHMCKRNKVERFCFVSVQISNYFHKVNVQMCCAQLVIPT